MTVTQSWDRASSQPASVPVDIPVPLVDELTHYLAYKKQTRLVFESPEGGPLRHSMVTPTSQASCDPIRLPNRQTLPRSTAHTRHFSIRSGRVGA